MDREVFLDTAYAVALVAQTDRFHQAAVEFAIRLTSEQTQVITTSAVVTEIGNSLSGQRYRASAVQLLDLIDNDPTITILNVTEAIHRQARNLYRNRMDKEWGLTDCISFVTMQERQMTEALTSDVHFEQAGFRALLREVVPG